MLCMIDRSFRGKERQIDGKCERSHMNAQLTMSTAVGGPGHGSRSVRISDHLICWGV